MQKKCTKFINACRKILFVCLFFLSTRVFFIHLETSPLPLKGCVLYSEFMTNQQWGFFNVPNLQWHGPISPKTHHVWLWSEKKTLPNYQQKIRINYTKLCVLFHMGFLYKITFQSICIFCNYSKLSTT